MEVECPNIDTCALVTSDKVIDNLIVKADYINKWCKAGELKWSECSRFITKNELNFCPDFVLPDSKLTPDEVIEKFDSEL